MVVQYQRYTVTSPNGDPFPLDMLRYDSCFPRLQADVEKISESITRRRHGGDERHPIVIDLGRYTRNPREDGPCSERWASFGWYVSDVHNRQS